MYGIKKNIVIIAIVVLLLVPVNVLATSTYILDIVNEGETKNLENDQGYVSKTITNIDEENGEVTIQLKVSNSTTSSEDYKNTEIFLVLDNSISMDYYANESSTRKSLIVSSVNELINSIYEASSDVKIGVVRFASKYSGTATETGKSYYQTSAANLMCSLTSDATSVSSAISEYSQMDTEAGTNIYAGLKMAYENFSSENNNKIIILLTDGVPTEYTESFYDYASTSSVDSNTKAYIEKIGAEVTLISMLTGLADDSTDADNIERIETIFGTSENPTSGYFYNISDSDIETVVETDIFNNVLSIVQNPIYNTTFIDYFPDDLLEYFDFEYVSEPNIGTVSEDIDEQTNSIEWNIGTLKGNETATLSYKLTMKDMENDELLDVVISTNDKAVLTYTDINSENYTVTLTNSPKVQLAEILDSDDDSGSNSTNENNTENVVTTSNDSSEDTTTVSGVLPQTGISYIKIVGLLFILVNIIIFTYVKINKYKNIE